MKEKLTLEYWQTQMDESWRETMTMVHRQKDIPRAIKEAFGHLISDPERLMRSETWDFKKTVNYFLIFQKPEKPTHGKKLVNMKNL